jgi:NTE family protein
MVAPAKISLALQGGGTHAAFTWGVIDQLLIDGRVGIDAISATSGGAMVAAVLAQGMLEGREAAHELLLQFWRKVSIASNLLPLRMNVVDTFLSHVGFDIAPGAQALDAITRLFSPSQFNLFDLNPLRGIVEEMVDFEAIKKGPVKLYMNATNAKTGRSRIFGPDEISLDAVMASSCLPFVFKTVEIDGEPYWDGGFSGCPPLKPLISDFHPSDIVLVQVHPSSVEDVPTTATDILDRATEISFNAVLLHELDALEQRNTMIRQGRIDGKPVTVHRIESQEMLSSLGRASKLNADLDFLIYLHDLGVQAATDWLAVSDGEQNSSEEAA